MTWRAAPDGSASHNGWQYCYETDGAVWLFAITEYGSEYLLSWGLCGNAVFNYNWQPIEYQTQGKIAMGTMEELQPMMREILNNPTPFIAEIILGLQ